MIVCMSVLASAANKCVKCTIYLELNHLNSSPTDLELTDICFSKF